MLETLQEYQYSEITLTFADEQEIPQLIVTRMENRYKITYFSNQSTEIHEDIYSAMDAIEKKLGANVPQRS